MTERETFILAYWQGEINANELFRYLCRVDGVGNIEDTETRLQAKENLRAEIDAL